MDVDLRFIVAFLLIMIKGLFRTYNQAGTFLLPLSNFCYHHFSENGDIAYFAYIVPPQGYHT